MRDILLRFRFGKFALGRGQVSHGASQTDFEIARVQFDQQVALLYLIVIVKVDRFDVSGNFWADLNYVAFDGSIIGRFIANIIQVPESAASQQKHTEAEKNNQPAT